MALRDMPGESTVPVRRRAGTFSAGSKVGNGSVCEVAIQASHTAAVPPVSVSVSCHGPGRTEVFGGLLKLIWVFFLPPLVEEVTPIVISPSGKGEPAAPGAIGPTVFAPGTAGFGG